MTDSLELQHSTRPNAYAAFSCVAISGACREVSVESYGECARRDTPGDILIKTAGSVLKRTQPDVAISKQRIRQIEGIQLVRINRDRATQNLCFRSRPFVLCGGLAGQIGSVEYSRERRFVAKLEQWLNIVRAMWLACPARILGGRTLALDHVVGIVRDF